MGYERNKIWHGMKDVVFATAGAAQYSKGLDCRVYAKLALFAEVKRLTGAENRTFTFVIHWSYDGVSWFEGSGEAYILLSVDNTVVGEMWQGNIVSPYVRIKAVCDDAAFVSTYNINARLSLMT